MLCLLNGLKSDDLVDAGVDLRGKTDEEIEKIIKQIAKKKEKEGSSSPF